MIRNQDYLTLNEHFLLGIPVLDKQHANLVRICNNLHLACINCKETGKDYFIQVVQKALEYVRYHFHTEEKLMCLLDFPEFFSHKKEHEDFVCEITGNVEQFQNDQVFILEEFVVFFTSWVKYHIGASDKAFADFFLNMKQYGKLKLILAEVAQFSVQSA
ncbi:MAG: hemerythrin family protein [Treponema sp.]|jgi:hemerythrin|nr:hemerythrin family protein [Treponema sp.]